MKSLLTRWRRASRVAVTATAATAAVAALLTAPAGVAHAQADCVVVDYQSTTWSTGPDTGGFVATITLTNICGAPINGWTLLLTLPPGHTLSNGWSANWSATGDQVTATDLPWNHELGSGVTITIGFVGGWVGAFQDPISCTINGGPCTGDPGENEPPEVTLTSPTDGQGILSVCPVTLEAEASDPDGAVERVEFYLNDMLVETDYAAPYRADVGYNDPARDPYVANTAYARVFDDASPALSADSEIVTFRGVAIPPALMIVACTPVLEVEEGGSATAVFSTSCQDPTQVDLAVTGDPGVAVSPTSFTSTHDGFGNAVTVSAAPGSAGATATINATSSTGNCLPANVAVTVVGSGPGRNEPPEVTLTSPISGVMHVSVCPVPLAAEASDPDGAVERVEFFVNDVLVNTDQEAPYQFNFGPGGPGAPISGSNTVFARAWDDGSPALSTDSAPATFLLVPPPPNIQIIGCPQRLEIEAGSSGVVDFRLSAQVTIPVELTVSGEADLTVSPTSFTLDSSGQEVTVNAAPGSAGTTGAITATSPMAFGFQVVIEVVGG